MLWGFWVHVMDTGDKRQEKILGVSLEKAMINYYDIYFSTQVTDSLH